MPLNNELFELANTLTQKTLEKKIKWIATSRSSEIQFNFDKGAVTVDKYKKMDEREYHYDIQIYNDNGDSIIRSGLTSEDKHYELLKNLYEIVEKSTSKIDETLESLFNTLKKI